MRLNHLTLQGYKSFATKSEFLFPTGITAIIGPNGSGKSNIADAIRWVLGEQRMRSLRGKSSADMIFAGGRRRARAGMAEVSLTLDNADGWLPIEFSEVTVTRRAYRSGENEYLLNGSRVRLRDITALLAESGLSQRAYTVIGQGLVDAALSLRPQERRTLFEEAAGISLYRSQREDAVRRLDETHRNLERVYDIVSEITPRMQRLKREAVRVEEHGRLAAHLERLLRTWYGYRWGRQQSVLDQALGKGSALEARLEEQQREVSGLGDRLVQLRQEEGDLRARLRDWHRESADLHDRATEVQRELAVTEERTRLLKARREELLAELEPLRRQQAVQAEQVAQVQARIAELGRDLAGRRTQLATLERDWVTVKERAEEPARQRAQAEEELRAHRARLEELNQALADARAEAARLESERAVAEERSRYLQARLGEIEAEIGPLVDQEATQAKRLERSRAQVEGLEQDLAERNKRLAALELEWQAAQRRAQEADRQRARVEQDLRGHRAALERLNQPLLESRAEAARLAGELSGLSRMRTLGSAHGTGVQTLLQADLDGVLGPLAGLIRVPAEWGRAVEAALGADVQAVVVERASLVEEVHRVLESAGGRVTLLPLDSLRPALPLPSGALCAAGVVACDEHVRPVVDAVLGPVALCDDVTAARALLAHMPPGSRCVTPAGIVLRSDGAVSVGQAGTEDGLADEEARQELAVQLEEVERRCQDLDRQQRAESEAVAQGEAELEALARQAAEAGREAARVERDTLGPARTEVAVAGEALRSQRDVMQRERSLWEQVEAQMAALRGQAGDLEAERADVEARLQELRARTGPADAGPGDAGDQEGFAQGEPAPGPVAAGLAATDPRIHEIELRQRAEVERVAALEVALQELAGQVSEAREEVARVERETVGPARTEVAVAGEALRSQQDTLNREEALLERLQAQEAARRQRVQELEVEYEGVVARARELRAEVSQMEAQLRQVRTRIDPAEDELTRLRDEQARLEQQERRARDRLRDVEARLGRAELDVARCRDELELLSRRIEEDLGLVELELADNVTAQTPLPLRPLVSQLPVVEILPEGLEEEIQRLKARLRRLGSVNPNAPADYAEVEERHRFLTEQSGDLEAASTQLREAVAELDEVMETAFLEMFEAVADRFSETFTALFNGGAARLELTEPDDLMNTGVDIVARPPGKRAQRLALLSGGERALTAAALLFALLHVSPTPFCVLDEVDAMLDEANVGRFRALLEELAEQTQFIVITHNRLTTEAAHAIYGVSMGADGVSQVVSLELD